MRTSETTAGKTSERYGRYLIGNEPHPHHHVPNSAIGSILSAMAEQHEMRLEQQSAGGRCHRAWNAIIEHIDTEKERLYQRPDKRHTRL